MTDNFNQLVNDPDIFQLLRASQQEIFSKINVMRIGIIDEILADNEVRCSITNKKLMGTSPDGTPIHRDYPPIYAKVWYMGSGNVGIDYPLTVGTPCLLLFNDREFHSYFTSGQVSPLANTLMHSLTYAVCVPLYQPITSDALNITSTNINLNGIVAVSTGASGTFTSQDGKTITVTDGVVTGIV